MMHHFSDFYIFLVVPAGTIANLVRHSIEYLYKDLRVSYISNCLER